MRDDTPTTRVLLASLAGYGDGYVSYRPKLNEVTGSALGSLFLVRLLWRWEHAGRQPFVRFSEPAPDHADYRAGQSWCEELMWSRRELDTAVGAISTRLPSGQSVLRYYEQELRQGVTPRLMAVRWQDGAHRTWWEVIEPAAGRLLAPVYLAFTERPVAPAPAPARAKGAAAAAGDLFGAPAGGAGGGAAKAELQRRLMGVLKQVTGTYGAREREAKAAGQMAADILAGEYTFECARDGLIELRDDTAWTGPKGWNEVRIRMTSFKPRWEAAQETADEAARRTASNNGRPPLREVQTVPVPPPQRRAAAGGGPRVDRDEERLAGRDYNELDR